MQLGRNLTIVALATATVALGTGCSLMLEWSEEGHPCSPSGECFAEYSCRVTTCIPKGSLVEKNPCTATDQCQSGLTCAKSLDFACRKECSQYLTTAGCNADTQYCKPVVVLGDDCTGSPCPAGQSCRTIDGGDRRCHYYQGVCVDGDACAPETEDEDCTGGDFCVPLGQSVNACLPGCQITWPSGDYSDNCGSVPLAQAYCTPLGVDAAQRLVCIDSNMGQGEGNGCNPVSNPCAGPTGLPSGLGCDGGYCHYYCDYSSGAGDTFCSGIDPINHADWICHTRSNANGDTYGICGNAI